MRRAYSIRSSSLRYHLVLPPRKLVEQIQPNLLRLVYHMVPPKALRNEGSTQAPRPAQATPRPIFRTLAAYACV
ncbi:hypothetical protein Pyn_29511 [Prunus yedoensis var. nudiflora]|uniref:Uncharacterized protein n=1 Tax=Prunus yedoensis var. nudiflora TaxID=2094558 RepID=A0A314Y2E1_PRUYE|nr:hypothetical protein Pyn_29511 [Prunus yedoensis var. nudiflora]